MHTTKPVAPLPAALAAALRSGTTIQTYSQAVVELVANSLDACSTCIDIILDTGSLSCSVKDNGFGVQDNSWGPLGTRYSTSKLRSFADLQSGVTSHGFRGEAMSSLAECCELSIVSRAEGSYETMSKVLQAGVCIQQGPAMQPMLSTGTLVHVKNMFFNQPVRRRPLMEQGHLLVKEQQATVQAVLQLALPHCTVAVTITEAGTKKMLLQLPKDRDLQALAWQLLPDQPPMPLLHSLQGPHSISQHGAYTAIGVLGHVANPYAGQDRQLLYINKRLVRHPALKQALNAWFYEASLRHQRAVEYSAQQAGRQRNEGPAHRGALKRACYPAYIILITCPTSHVDVTSEPDKSAPILQDADAVMTVLKSLSLQAWGVPTSAHMTPSLQGPDAAAGPSHSSRKLGGNVADQSHLGHLQTAAQGQGAECGMRTQQAGNGSLRQELAAQPSLGYQSQRHGSSRQHQRGPGSNWWDVEQATGASGTMQDIQRLQAGSTGVMQPRSRSTSLAAQLACAQPPRSQAAAVAMSEPVQVITAIVPGSSSPCMERAAQDMRYNHDSAQVEQVEAGQWCMKAAEEDTRLHQQHHVRGAGSGREGPGSPFPDLPHMDVDGMGLGTVPDPDGISPQHQRSHALHNQLQHTHGGQMPRVHMECQGQQQCLAGMLDWASHGVHVHPVQAPKAALGPADPWAIGPSPIQEAYGRVLHFTSENSAQRTEWSGAGALALGCMAVLTDCEAFSPMPNAVINHASRLQQHGALPTFSSLGSPGNREVDVQVCHTNQPQGLSLLLNTPEGGLARSPDLQAWQPDGDPVFAGQAYHCSMQQSFSDGGLPVSVSPCAMSPLAHSPEWTLALECSEAKGGPTGHIWAAPAGMYAQQELALDLQLQQHQHIRRLGSKQQQSFAAAAVHRQQHHQQMQQPRAVLAIQQQKQKQQQQEGHSPGMDALLALKVPDLDQRPAAGCSTAMTAASASSPAAQALQQAVSTHLAHVAPAASVNTSFGIGSCHGGGDPDMHQPMVMTRAEATSPIVGASLLVPKRPDGVLSAPPQGEKRSRAEHSGPEGSTLLSRQLLDTLQAGSGVHQCNGVTQGPAANDQIDSITDVTSKRAASAAALQHQEVRPKASRCKKAGTAGGVDAGPKAVCMQATKRLQSKCKVRTPTAAIAALGFVPSSDLVPCTTGDQAEAIPPLQADADRYVLTAVHDAEVSTPLQEYKDKPPQVLPAAILFAAAHGNSTAPAEDAPTEDKPANAAESPAAVRKMLVCTFFKRPRMSASGPQRQPSATNSTLVLDTATAPKPTAQPPVEVIAEIAAEAQAVIIQPPEPAPGLQVAPVLQRGVAADASSPCIAPGGTAGEASPLAAASAPGGEDGSTLHAVTMQVAHTQEPQVESSTPHAAASSGGNHTPADDHTPTTGSESRTGSHGSPDKLQAAVVRAGSPCHDTKQVDNTVNILVVKLEPKPVMNQAETAGVSQHPQAQACEGVPMHAPAQVTQHQLIPPRPQVPVAEPSAAMAGADMNECVEVCRPHLLLHSSSTGRQMNTMPGFAPQAGLATLWLQAQPSMQCAAPAHRASRSSSSIVSGRAAATPSEPCSAISSYVYGTGSRVGGVLQQWRDSTRGTAPPGSTQTDAQILTVEQLLMGMPGRPSAAVLLGSEAGRAGSAGAVGARSSLLSKSAGRAGSGGGLMRSRVGGADDAFHMAGVLAPAVGRDTLQDVRVLGQVDRKFVLVICGNGLLALDQHGAHERIRLEHLTAQLEQAAADTYTAQTASAPPHSSPTRPAGAHSQAPLHAAVCTLQGALSRQGHAAASGSSAWPAASILVEVCPEIHATDSKGASVKGAPGTDPMAEAELPLRSTGGAFGPDAGAGALPLCSVPLLPAQFLIGLGPHEAEALLQYKDRVAAWGWQVTQQITAVRGGYAVSVTRKGSAGSRKEPSSGGWQPASGSNMVAQSERTPGLEQLSGTSKTGDMVLSGMGSLLLTHVPSVYGVKLTATDLQAYLQQLHSTHGARLLPPAALAVLRSKACRSAIMFGDTLTPAQCNTLLSCLAATQVWDQCAHGRPTVGPLVDLAQLDRLQSAWQRTRSSLIGTVTGTASISSIHNVHLLGPLPISVQGAGQRHGTPSVRSASPTTQAAAASRRAGSVGDVQAAGVLGAKRLCAGMLQERVEQAKRMRAACGLDS